MIKDTTTTWKFFIASGEGDRGFWGITGEGGQSFLTGCKGKLKKIGTANDGGGGGKGGRGGSKGSSEYWPDLEIR